MITYSLIVFTDFENSPYYTLIKGDYGRYNELYINSVDAAESGLEDEMCEFLLKDNGAIKDMFTKAIPLTEIYLLMSANDTNPQYEIVQVNTGMIP
jgi:hypothetical protein